MPNIFNWKELEKKFPGLTKGELDSEKIPAVFGHLAKTGNALLDAALFTPKKHIHNFRLYQQGGKELVQAFTSSASFPESVLRTYEKFRETLHTDDAWELSFKMIGPDDPRIANRNGFEVENVRSGITFSLVPDGGKIKIYSASGEKFRVEFDMYGGGIQWSRRLIDDLEYWTIDDNFVTFVNKWNHSRASAGWGMIQALPSSQNVAWAAPTPAALATSDPNYAAIRDFNTINAAIIEILEDVKDAGYGVTPDSAFIIHAPIQLKPRLDRAMGILNGQLAGVSYDGVRFNVRVVYNMSLTSKTAYYVSLPGIKNYFADRKVLEIQSQYDMLSYSDVAAGWGRYGGGIFDIRQWRRCATA